METKSITKKIGRVRRHARVRAKVVGTAARPRLAVYKSNRYLHAQLIDDEKGVTILSGSTKAAKASKKQAKKMDAAKLLGADLAKRAQAAGVSTVVFDRGGFRYTGRVATLAEAARAAGLKF
jgi:large subunit ribosomal protein L18